MTRLHIGVSVKNLKESVAFYNALFDAEPTVLKPDYAKWALDDPQVNFAITESNCGAPGINHLGIEASDERELENVYARLRASKGEIFEEGETTCCYANSTKNWVVDPQDVLWEAFLTHGASETFGASPEASEVNSATCACSGAS